MPEKLLIDARHLKSGIGVYTGTTLKLIHEMHDEKAFAIDLLGNEDELKKQFPKFGIIHDTTKIYSFAEQRSLFRITKKYDFYHATHFNIPLFYKGNLIATIYDVTYLALPCYRKNPVRLLYAQLFFKTIKEKASKIITISQFSKNEIIAHTGIPENKITVVYCGIESGFSSGSSVDSSSADNYSPYIYFVGNVKPHKNIDGMIRGFLLAKEKYGLKHKLLIAGAIEKAKYFSNTDIVFLSHIPEAKLKLLYRNADLHLLLSFYEGFGMPPFEALASGTPTLVSDIPVFREIYKDAAFYCNPNDAEDIAKKIFIAITDKESRKNCLLKSEQLLPNFSWTKSAEKIYGIYKELLLS